VADWFASRGIDTDTLQQAGVTWARRYSYEDKAVVDVAAFPSTREGVVVNVKLREVNRKRFSQLAGGERVFYGYDEAKVGVLRMTGCLTGAVLEEMLVLHVLSPVNPNALYPFDSQHPADHPAVQPYSCLTWKCTVQWPVVAGQRHCDHCGG
jgi:hypothetical protein